MGGFFSIPSNLNFGQALGGGFGAASGFFPQTSTTTSNGSSSSSGTSTTNPVLSAQGQSFLDTLFNQYNNYLAQSPDLSGYQASQANAINNNANLSAANLNANLAARGLATSPVAASLTNTNNLNRIGQLNTLNQSIPLLQRQLQSQALSQGNQFFNSIPRGSTTNQNQNQTFNQTQKTSSGGGIGGLLSGIGSVAALFSDERLKSDMKPMKNIDSIKLLSKLKPMSFKWKENGEDGHGFSAQQVSKVLPKSVVKDDEGFHRLDMIQVIPHLVNAVNSLSKTRKAA